MNLRRPTTLLGALALLAITAAACSESGGAADGSAVEVSLKDYSIDLSADSVAPGAVTFEASNTGPTTHEFEVFSVDGDVDPNALPVEDGVAKTDGLTLIDEVEDVTVGATPTLQLDLQPGTYAVICNLPDHYEKGMHTVLTVR
jgi:uncharacterized cupredoxin-like copper-binding protein